MTKIYWLFHLLNISLVLLEASMISIIRKFTIASCFIIQNWYVDKTVHLLLYILLSVELSRFVTKCTRIHIIISTIVRTGRRNKAQVIQVASPHQCQCLNQSWVLVVMKFGLKNVMSLIIRYKLHYSLMKLRIWNAFAFRYTKNWLTQTQINRWLRNILLLERFS